MISRRVQLPWVLLSFLSSAAFVAACGGSQPAPAPVASPAAAPMQSAPPAEQPAPAPQVTASAAASPAPASAPPAPTAFKDMNEDQRKEFMKTKVLPKMKDEFSA